MKSQNTAKRSSLFLMELMIAILFFSLASAVCVQLFVKSHLLTQESQNLNKAVNQAQSVAEAIRATDGSLQKLSGYFPQSHAAGDTLSLYYSKEWDPCEKQKAYYQLDAAIHREPRMLRSTVTVSACRDNARIYQLNVDKYLSLAR